MSRGSRAFEAGSPAVYREWSRRSNPGGLDPRERISGPDESRRRGRRPLQGPGGNDRRKAPTSAKPGTGPRSRARPEGLIDVESAVLRDKVSKEDRSTSCAAYGGRRSSSGPDQKRRTPSSPGVLLLGLGPLASEDSPGGAVKPDQYSNPANPAGALRRPTGARDRRPDRGAHSRTSSSAVSGQRGNRVTGTPRRLNLRERARTRRRRRRSTRVALDLLSSGRASTRT